MQRLAGKVALVTGGARGIAFAVARAFAPEGAVMTVADINGDGAVQAAASLGEQATGLAVNVADQTSVQPMVDAITGKHGRLDILVNNAGVGANTLFLETKLEDWNRIIGINLTGAFLVAQACAREVVNGGGGKIVNIASLSGQRGGNGRAAYGAAEARLEPLTKVMIASARPGRCSSGADQSLTKTRTEE